VPHIWFSLIKTWRGRCAVPSTSRIAVSESQASVNLIFQGNASLTVRGSKAKSEVPHTKIESMPRIVVDAEREVFVVSLEISSGDS
jgi:hypothetical protein